GGGRRTVKTEVAGRGRRLESGSRAEGRAQGHSATGQRAQSSAQRQGCAMLSCPRPVYVSYAPTFRRGGGTGAADSAAATRCGRREPTFMKIPRINPRAAPITPPII